MKFNLFGENKLDESSVYTQIQNDHNKTNKNAFDSKMIINNQLNNLFKNNNEEKHSQIFNFSPNKQATKLKMQENNSEKKNMPSGFKNNMLDYNYKIDLNSKFSNSEKKNIQAATQSMNYLNYMGYNQINNVHSVNKSNINQMDNNCFFPISNNLTNFNLINPDFQNINQNGNFNMNFFNYNNYQNFLAMNLTNNLMNTNINNNIQCNNKNYKNSAYSNEFQQGKLINSKIFLKINYYFSIQQQQIK